MVGRFGSVRDVGVISSGRLKRNGEGIECFVGVVMRLWWFVDAGLE